MQIGTILKKFRQRRNLTQDELCQGIISRQAYSRIENNLSEPNSDILRSLLSRLNYQISDFWREATKGEPLEECYKYFLKGIAGQLNRQQAQELMALMPDITEKSNRYLHFSAMLKAHLHSQFPDIIPSLSDYEENRLKDYILNLTDFSVYDLRIIGDFAPRLLDYELLKEVFYTLPDLHPYDYGEESSIYRTQVHKIYNNFCDIALQKDDLPFAEFLLEKHQAFAAVHKDLRYLSYLRINEIVFEYKITKDTKRILKLQDIIYALTVLGDKQTAGIVQYEMDSYLNETYNPSKSIVMDR
ncbi:hypothetical protein Q9S_02854 [Enterococcus faecalis EnGen0080]|uniref:helix-turn-helix domain-containing protein n=1 Tax=Enterococcus faecalis TaxID=1351 RepID=UPI00032E7434|nr:helix-turn-helix transcriptional regulator [Enterococcus faecalis]EOE09548.1 hypothetical protein Q9S_02854 [Enterococcus faecalis EnGen0080]MEB7428396.1 helix-turn-helix domain-containing protein [Enterococcus faecalis]